MSDDFLIAIADISAALIGLFLVGMIFYIQTGFDRLERSRGVIEPYFRAATLITFISFAIPLAVSLTLVAVPIFWSRVLYGTLVIGLIMVNVTTVKAVRECIRVVRLRLLVMMEVVGTAVVTLMVILPLATGGLTPERGDFVPGILLSLGIGFLSTCVLVLTLFDIARFERSASPDLQRPNGQSVPRNVDVTEGPGSTEGDGRSN